MKWTPAVSMPPSSRRTRRGIRTRTSSAWRPRAHPDRFAILGNFPLDKPESRALVDTWKQRPGMLGCRFTFIGPDQSTWPTDGIVDWLWPAAERAGLPIAMMAANFLPKVTEVAQRHPNLKLILDHLGRPRGDTSPSERCIPTSQ